jgi:uncharacterized LabA/DUF88 family protein
MDRYAIFADAGYIYAAGGALVLDETRRSAVTLNAHRLLELLRTSAEGEHGAGDFLRMYWYDAAPNALPQSDHLQIGAIPGIKIRLGRLTMSGQKGVDALIFRDMLKLASEHAITTAFLFSGDEDLRQAVEEAQDLGVKVVLIGVAPTLDSNQSDILVREADAHVTFEYQDLAECIGRREVRPYLPFIEGPRPETPVPLPGFIEEPHDDIPILATPTSYGHEADSAAPPKESASAAAPDGEASVYHQIGRTLGEEWLAQQPQDEIRYLRSVYPRIPRDVDSEILRRLVAASGLPSWARVEEEARIDGRAGFWAALGLGIERPDENREIGPINESNPYQYGLVFAAAWIERAAADEVEQARMLLLRNIGLPAQVDRLLLRVSAQQFGDPVPVQVKHELRRGFRDGLLA